LATEGSLARDRPGFVTTATSTHRFSFIDGPVTANKVMGVHTAWGRTLKNVFQRYQALRGFHQRYQNGWDCQGLWIEVGVEKALGLNSKREIEEYGLDRFAEKCREVVAWSSQELRRASKRLGQWMDWERDYYTFSDTNIEYRAVPLDLRELCHSACARHLTGAGARQRSRSTRVAGRRLATTGRRPVVSVPRSKPRCTARAKTLLLLDARRVPSKPAGRRSPAVGRFDSFAASLGRRPPA
jgi:hypothetical protein